MDPRKNYYLNDYFDLFKQGYSREKEYMKTDIYDKLNNYVVEIDLPGIKKENVKINYDNGYLSIKISRNIVGTSINSYIRRERFYGDLKRSFYIGLKKTTDIKAMYKDGVLTISFPKEDIQNESTNNIKLG